MPRFDPCMMFKITGDAIIPPCSNPYLGFELTDQISHVDISNLLQLLATSIV